MGVYWAIQLFLRLRLALHGYSQAPIARIIYMYTQAFAFYVRPAVPIHILLTCKVG